MNNTNLVTGYRAENHITSEDVGALYAGIVGEGKYVLPTERQLEAELVSNNLVRIHSGDAVINGRHVRILPNTYEDLVIENGEQGAVSYALVYFHYTKDSETGVEDCGTYILNNAPSTGETEYTDCSISAGDAIVDFPLYLIKSEGISVTNVKQLFDVPANLISAAADIKQSKANITSLNTKYAALSTALATEKARGSKILFQTTNGWLMAETTTLTLSEKVSAQRNGIKLLWASGDDKENADYDVQITDIDKNAVKLKSGKGYACPLIGGNFTSIGVKYVYITDKEIRGSARNLETGTKNGITYNNKRYYLFAVVGY